MKTFLFKCTNSLSSTILNCLVTLNLILGLNLGLADKSFADENKLIKSLGFKPDQVSFHVVKLDKLKEVKKHNHEEGFVPASTQKLLTAIYALKALGANHHFYTRLSYSGQISSEQIDGDLFLIGGGDPYLQYSDLFKLALELKKKGIKKISGKFYFSQSELGQESIIEDDGLLDEGYNSGVSALSVNFNQAHVFKEKGSFKTLADGNLISFNATSKVFPKDMRFSTAGSDDEWFFSTKRSYKKINLVPIRYPALYTAQIFHHFLSILGIQSATPTQIKKDLPPLQELSAIKSLSVERLISLNFEYSNNLISELLLMHATKKLYGKTGDLKICSMLMQKWFIENYQVKPKNFKLTNGSGLGAYNKISTKIFTQVLAPNIYDLWPLMPISSIKGGLARRFYEQDKSFKIWAKTGTIDFVSAIVGVFISKNNQQYLFSLMVNDHKRRNKLTSMGLKQSYGLRQNAPKWRQRANQLENKLLDMWIKNL